MWFTLSVLNHRSQSFKFACTSRDRNRHTLQFFLRVCLFTVCRKDSSRWMLWHDVKTKANTNECPSYIRLEKSAQSWDGKILTYTTVEKYVAFSHKEQDFTVIFEVFMSNCSQAFWKSKVFFRHWLLLQPLFVCLTIFIRMLFYGFIKPLNPDLWITQA